MFHRPLLTALTRRQFGRLISATAVSAVTGTSYAWQIEPRRLAITRRSMILPRLPGSLDGLKVAVLSDIHFDPSWQEKELLDAITATNAEAADLVLLPGDFITRDPSVMNALAPLLGRLTARHGIFASMGNHDAWHSSSERIRAALTPHGIELLCNQSTRLYISGQRLDIVGTDSVWGGTMDVSKAFVGTRASSTLALVHEPDPFEQLGQASFLQLSGHTHGGQCRVPLMGYAPVKVRYGRKYIYGEFSQAGGGRLFVTRGLGTVGLRVRFACVPEVAILTLRAMA